ncbi:MAG: heparan-alpha-glucosaminide N-acetyltransferase domain-containing protein [Polyangiaceae bacterium]
MGIAPKAERDATYDVLRGLAIITMLCANVIGYVSPTSAHPLWLRFYGSFAAPLFVTLAGLSGAMGVRNKGYGFGYFFKRGALIILTGSLLIDVAIWRILPFTTYDVLYVIGFAFMALFFFEKLSLTWKTLVVLLSFAASPILQRLLGYTDTPSEYDLHGRLTVTMAHPTPIWQHWLVDGWFPVFPWIGFAFVGSLMLDIKKHLGSFRDWRVVLGSLLLAVVGGVTLWRFSFASLLHERGAYDEIFYPPTLSYLVLAVGVLGLLAAAVEGIAAHPAFFPVSVLGRASMFIYILHTAIVQFVVLPRFTAPETEIATGTLGDSFIVYGLMTLVCLLAALALHFIKRKWKIRNFVLRFYVGS